MPRPKKNTEAGNIAYRKWQETMTRKYGRNYKEVMRQWSSAGGRAGNTGGFYNAPERAKIAGSAGGRISRKGYKMISKNDKEIVYLRKSDNKKFVYVIATGEFKKVKLFGNLL